MIGGLIAYLIAGVFWAEFADKGVGAVLDRPAAERPAAAGKISRRGFYAWNVCLWPVGLFAMTFGGK